MADPPPVTTQGNQSEEKQVKAPNLMKKAKEEIGAVFHHKKSPQHHKETHGTSDDIDAKTPVGAIKAPNVFSRVKDEAEAVFEAIHHKKDSGDNK